MANIDDGFRIETLSINDEVLVTGGDVQPNIGGGYEAPQGSLYLRTSTGTDGELYIKFGPNNVDWNIVQADGADTAVLGFGEWTFDNSLTAPPGNKNFRFNNADVTLATKLYVDYTNEAGNDLTNFLNKVDAGSVIYAQKEKDSTAGFVTEITGGTDQGDYVEYDITNTTLLGLSTLENNKKYTFIASLGTDLASIDKWESFSADTGSTSADTNTDTLTIAGGSGISTAIVGDTLTINSTAASADLASLLCGITTDIAIPTTFANVDFNVTHLENDTNVLEHDPANADRFLIKETGLYFLNFSMSFDADAGEESISGQFVINDTTVVPGSLRTASEDDEINDLSNVITASLTAGDYVTFQHVSSGAGNLLNNTSAISITRARGSQGEDGADGEPGPPGSGTTVNVLDEGVSVPNSPHSAFNFVGDYVTATDAGGGQADITITNPVFGTEYQYASAPSVTSTTSTTFLNKLTFNTSSLPAGTYRVAIRYGWNHNSAANDFEGRLQEDGIDVGEIHKQEPKDSAGTFSTTGTSQRNYYNKVAMRTLTAGVHTYTFDFRTDTAGTASSAWEVDIELWRVQ